LAFRKKLSLRWLQLVCALDIFDIACDALKMTISLKTSSKKVKCLPKKWKNESFFGQLLFKTNNKI